MKKKLLLLLCMGLTLSGCAKTGNKTSVEVSTENTNTTGVTAENETSESQSGNATAVTKMVNIPFGYQQETGYQQYFIFKIPASAEFIAGTANYGNDTVEGGLSCADFAPNAGDAQLDYATFADTDFFNGTFTVYVYNMEQNFDGYAKSWMNYAESALSSFEVTRNSGELNGYSWKEIYGLNTNGSFQYSVLVDLGDQMTAEFSLLGGDQGEIHDYSEAHSYFFDAFAQN